MKVKCMCGAKILIAGHLGTGNKSNQPYPTLVIVEQNKVIIMSASCPSTHTSATKAQSRPRAISLTSPTSPALRTCLGVLPPLLSLGASSHLTMAKSPRMDVDNLDTTDLVSMENTFCLFIY
jgi:RCC1 and BTB domain-containing protein